jgi:hypothetical protein
MAASATSKLAAGSSIAIGAALTTRTTQVTAAGIARIEAHLGRLGTVGDPANAAMIARLKAGETAAQDINFYLHEMREAEIMGERGGYGVYELERAAHLETLEWQGISYEAGYEAQLYHPEVIRQFPELFNPAAWPQ